MNYAIKTPCFYYKQSDNTESIELTANELAFLTKDALIYMALKRGEGFTQGSLSTTLVRSSANYSPPHGNAIEYTVHTFTGYYNIYGINYYLFDKNEYPEFKVTVNPFSGKVIIQTTINATLHEEELMYSNEGSSFDYFEILGQRYNINYQYDDKFIVTIHPIEDDEVQYANPCTVLLHIKLTEN